MTTPVIIDVAIVVLLVMATALGAKRGLLKSLAGLVILVVALVGAGMVSASFAPHVTKIVAPLLEDYVSSKVEEAVTERITEADLNQIIVYETDLEGLGIGELLERLGVDPEALDAVIEDIRSSVKEAGSGIVDAVTAAVVGNLIQSVVYGILFLLSFLLLFLLLHVLFCAMGLVLKLPGLHFLNAAGGGLLGFVQGALLLFLLAWVARKLGVSFDTELFRQTNVLRIFTTYTPLSVLSFLTR